MYIHPNRNGHSGCVTVVKSSIPHSRIRKPINCGRDVEVVAVKIKLPTTELCLYNIYRKAPRVLQAERLFAHLSTQQGIAAGDFNAHHPLLNSTAGTNATGSHLAHLLEDFPTVTLLNNGEPTHTRGGRLDLSFTSEAIGINTTWRLHPNLTSDHFAVLMDVDLATPTMPLPEPRWNLKEANWTLFRSSIDEWWRDYTPAEDLDQRERDFTGAITCAADVAIPKTMPSKARRKGWWYYTPEVKAANRRLTDARRSHKRNPCPETIEFLREAAHRKREVAREQRTKCWLEWCETFDRSTSLGMLWKQLKVATGRPPPRRPAHHDPEAEAERLAEEFESRGSATVLPAAVQQRQLALQPSRTRALRAACEEQAPTDQPFTPQELDMARKGRKDTAPGADGIRYSMLRCAGPSADAAFISLMNLSWREGRVPGSWKFGDIIVVEKPGTTRAEPKLRPLTMLGCPGKTAEKMVLQRLQWQIGPFHHNIFGFVAGSSTTDCIMTFLAIVNNSEAIAVFLDLEKAFELASPAAMLDAFVKKGVRGRMLAWLEDYLQGRRSRVRYQGTSSTYRAFDLGTPQGGILSPTSFNTLMEQLVSLPLPPGCHLLSYADDLVLVVSRRGNKLAKTRTALRQIEDKCEELGLKISPEKSSAMHLFPSKTAPPGTVKVQGTELTWVGKHLYLGVVIDQRLTFAPETERLCERVQARLNVMRAMTSPAAGAHPAVLRTFYVHAVRSLVDYAAPVLTSLAPTWQTKLERTQNSAMRTILGAPKWTMLVAMRAETGLAPLSLRVKQLAANHTAKALQRNRPGALRNVLGGRYDSAYNNSRKWSHRTAAAFSLLLGDHLQQALEMDLPHPDYRVQPPWEEPILTLVYTGTERAKVGYTTEELRQRALESMEQYHNIGAQLYYTDGSVDPDTGNSSSAFVTSTTTQAWRNTNNASSLQVELKAISAALHHANGGPNEKIIILTDSKASMQTLCRPAHRDNIALTTTILARVRQLVEQGAKVCLHWIPSHVGVRGNEEADQAARRALTHPEIAEHIRPSLDITKKRIRDSATTLAQQERELAATTSTTLQWYLAATEGCPLRTKEVDRRTLVALQRLRLGYITGSELRQEDHTCEHCQTTDANPLIHFLLYCPATRRLRTGARDNNGTERARATSIVKRLSRTPEEAAALLRETPPPR